jgi:hypothetical protein
MEPLRTKMTNSHQLSSLTPEFNILLFPNRMLTGKGGINHWSLRLTLFNHLTIILQKLIQKCSIFFIADISSLLQIQVIEKYNYQNYSLISLIREF